MRDVEEVDGDGARQVRRALEEAPPLGATEERARGGLSHEGERRLAVAESLARGHLSVRRSPPGEEVDGLERPRFVGAELVRDRGHHELAPHRSRRAVRVGAEPAHRVLPEPHRVHARSRAPPRGVALQHRHVVRQQSPTALRDGERQRALAAALGREEGDRPALRERDRAAVEHQVAGHVERDGQDPAQHVEARPLLGRPLPRTPDDLARRGVRPDVEVADVARLQAHPPR